MRDSFTVKWQCLERVKVGKVGSFPPRAVVPVAEMRNAVAAPPLVGTSHEPTPRAQVNNMKEITWQLWCIVKSF